MYHISQTTGTYDHNLMKTGHPVRSGIHKHKSAGLVLKSVTIWESPVLYVFDFFGTEILFWWVGR